MIFCFYCVALKSKDCCLCSWNWTKAGPRQDSINCLNHEVASLSQITYLKNTRIKDVFNYSVSLLISKIIFIYLLILKIYLFINFHTKKKTNLMVSLIKMCQRAILDSMIWTSNCKWFEPKKIAVHFASVCFQERHSLKEDGKTEVHSREILKT